MESNPRNQETPSDQTVSGSPLPGPFSPSTIEPLFDMITNNASVSSTNDNENVNNNNNTTEEEEESAVIVGEEQQPGQIIETGNAANCDQANPSDVSLLVPFGPLDPLEKAVKLLSDTIIEKLDIAGSCVDADICSCGRFACNESCTVRGIIANSGELDEESSLLTLKLATAYLALGKRNKDHGELVQALNAVELACRVLSSMPKDDLSEKFEGKEFWSSAWGLVADVYVEFHKKKESIGCARSGGSAISSSGSSSRGPGKSAKKKKVRQNTSGENKGIVQYLKDPTEESKEYMLNVSKTCYAESKRLTKEMIDAVMKKLRGAK